MAMTKMQVYGTIALIIAVGLPTLFMLSRGGSAPIGNEPLGKTKQPKGGIISKERPKNIILMIGDGMGLTQITAGSIAKKDGLALEKFRHIGLVRTYARKKLVTDSAAGATAMATGEKTYNGAISMSVKQEKLKTIVQYAEEVGIATGILTTTHVTHATPACFFSHQPTRSNVNELVAADFMLSDIEVLMGGGWDYFGARKDGRDLVKEASDKGYFVVKTLGEMGEYCPKKLICLPWAGLPPSYKERGNFLQLATKKALGVLSAYPDGFFLVIEGGQIDLGGHAKNSDYIIGEMLDFDLAVTEALAFAEKDGNTLVVVTADHETGGYSINGGNLDSASVQGAFTTDYHTATMVPIFAYGMGAESFMGVMENTDIFHKLYALLCIDEKRK